MSAWDYETDVVVVGSGSAGMTTAWTAAQCGLDALVLEKTEVYGGNSAMSGGGAWMPNAPELIRHGQRDDPAKVVSYLRNIAPEVDRARHERFVEECGKVAAALEATPHFRNGYYWGKGYSDYHPSKGGNPLGRGIWPNPMDLRALQQESAGLRQSALMAGAPKGVWMTSAEVSDVIRVRWGASLRRYKMMMKMGWRKVHAHLTGAEMITSGRSLMARLRLALRDAGVPLWLKSPMKSLIVENGAVVGVNAERDGKPIRIRARRGVMIAAGGFEFSEELRRKFQPLLGGVGHSHGSPGNTGDGIMAGADIGAAIDLMDDAWWMPAIDTPGMPRPTVMERQAPNQYVVNIEGKRFVNESGPYTDFGHAVLAGQARGVDHTKFYMIMDHEAWTHNIVASHMPGMPAPQAWLDAGTLVIANTIEELAKKIGVPPDTLAATHARFNAFAAKGVDEDFHRGESAYDNFYGDHRQPNPNLREVKTPPFYAFRMVLGDLGTKGGLVTNENAQVLDQNGRVIPGLYAAGNSSASMMGHSYAGPGATIGPAMTFGWIAAHIMAGRNEAISPAPVAARA
ncbi:MAG: FAD-dependent oxidoreductase [Hyphomonadaceae bacterium]|nr:FAD-dependent oxidoreductase [Hyphomonadaceae bacterium]